MSDLKAKRFEHRYIVDLPAYASTTETETPWSAKVRLKNVSLTGLLLELPAVPPFSHGELLRICWQDVAITGEVRHVTSRPGFVGMGVQIREVISGSVLECAEIGSHSDAAVSEMSQPLFSPAWNVEQVERGKIVQNVINRAVNVILEFVPDAPERAAAIRKIAEAAGECSAAIAHQGTSDAKR